MRLGDQTLIASPTATARPSALETNVTDERARTGYLQADYTRTLGQHTKLETGYKGTLRTLDNSFDVATSPDGGATFAADLGRSNAFTYDEQVHAVYGVLSRTAGPLDLHSARTRRQALTTTFSTNYLQQF